MKIWTALIMTFVLISVGCASKKTRSADNSELPNEVSLAEDRAEVAKRRSELRQDIPPEKQAENDRLAEMLKRWQEVKMKPDQLRDKFDNEIRKSRAGFEKDIKRRRDEFNSKIKSDRESFREKQKDERDDFKGTKVSKEKRDAFYTRQEDERRRFEAEVQERRQDFDDGIREERKNYDDGIANLRSEFRTEFPAYRKRYDELMKQKEEDKESRKNHDSNVPSSAEQVAPQTGSRAYPASDDGLTSDLTEFEELKRKRKQKQAEGQ